VPPLAEPLLGVVTALDLQDNALGRSPSIPTNA
jgi:hypothetical protein